MFRDYAGLILFILPRYFRVVQIMMLIRYCNPGGEQFFVGVLHSLASLFPNTHLAHLFLTDRGIKRPPCDSNGDIQVVNYLVHKK